MSGRRSRSRSKERTAATLGATAFRATAFRAAGYEEPAEPENVRVLRWWVENHLYFLNLLIQNFNKYGIYFAYYGGFALNFLHGHLEKAKTIREAYDIGVKRLGHTSDIDLKCLLPSNIQECNVSENILKMFSEFNSGFSDKKYEVLAKSASYGTPYAIVADERDLAGSPLKYIIAHNFKYSRTGPDKCQVILTGILSKDDSTQVLTEISFKEIDGKDILEQVFLNNTIKLPILFYPVSQLCDQFIDQYSFFIEKLNNLKSRNITKADHSKEMYEAKLDKTLKRIKFCLRKILDYELPDSSIVEPSEKQFDFLAKEHKELEEKIPEAKYIDKFRNSDEFKKIGNNTKDKSIIINDLIRISYILNIIKKGIKVKEEYKNLSRCPIDYKIYLNILIHDKMISKRNMQTLFEITKWKDCFSMPTIPTPMRRGGSRKTRKAAKKKA